MTDIEPEDLIRDHDGEIVVSQFDWSVESPFTLIAKGPGWTRHDGSSVNPVPGSECEVRGSLGEHYQPDDSDQWAWSLVQFYRVTREAPSQPPAPQPGWVATVTLTYDLRDGPWDRVRFPSGWVAQIGAETTKVLDWKPPAPVLRVGGLAEAVDGDTVTVKYIGKRHAFVEDATGEEWLPAISSLTPLEDEGQ